MQKENGIKAYGFSPVLTFPFERILIAKRKHLFVLTAPFLTVALFFIATNVIGIMFFGMILKSPFLAIATILAATIITIGIISKFIIDWYGHWYVVTTHKILDIYSVPFFSQKVSEVLLDQVRCTEVDIQISGMLNNLINKGNIVITFDRPTHQEEFVIADIKNPMFVGTALLDSFNKMRYLQEKKGLWTRTKEDPRNLQFSPDIIEDQHIGIN